MTITHSPHTSCTDMPAESGALHVVNGPRCPARAVPH